MATLEQEKEMRETLNQNLEALLGISIESLIRRDELGASLNFEEGKPYFERVIKLFRDIKDTNLDGISYEALSQINNQAVIAIGDFKNIREFSIDKYPQNTKSTRDQFISTVRDRYDEFYKILTPHIAYGIRKGTDFAALEKQARETAEKIIELTGQLVQKQKETEKEAKEILDSMRKAAGEAGVSQNAIYFSLEAEEHKSKAESWLTATKWMAGATILFAVLATVAFFIFTKDFSFEQALQLAVAKVLIFSVFYYATIWCGKNYRAYVHNYVVNKHRQNGLSTFQAFVKATEDQTIKNAVLLKATESIFGLANSGFISSDSEQSGSSQILEIIRSGFESKGGKG